jgi:hypothetical protein
VLAVVVEWEGVLWWFMMSSLVVETRATRFADATALKAPITACLDRWWLDAA